VEKGDDLVLAEIGLDHLDVGASAMRVFARACGAAAEDGELPDGWVAVSKCAEAMFGGTDDGELSLSFPQFAALLRRGFARAEAAADDLPDFDALAPRARRAWVAVARHLANVFSFEPDDVRKLPEHEDRIVAWALSAT
jgi:hypothetical protein